LAYTLNTPADRQAMLRAVGAASFDDLLAAIPAAVRLRRPLNLPPPSPSRI